jgi:hypothetical protein
MPWKAQALYMVAESNNQDEPHFFASRIEVAAPIRAGVGRGKE